MTGPAPSRAPDPADFRAPLRLAHRGDWRVAPENTIAALTAAMAIPACNGVEFDVRLACDGTPVVIHDATLARVQGRDARVDELDAGDLAALGVPTLADVMAALPGAWMDVELKGPHHGEATAEVLRAARGDRPADAVVSSFAPASLQAMEALLPGWPRWLGVLADDPGGLARAIGMGCAGISADWRMITPALVRTASEAGLEVAAWTVRRRATFARLARLGVRACCVEAAALDGDATPARVGGDTMPARVGGDSRRERTR
jgi:glycerophosphoryl diester phosphodiesterase